MRNVSILMLLAAFAVSGLSNAAEAPPQPAAATEAAADSPADEPKDAAEKAEEQAAEAKPQDKPAAGQKSSPQRFVPSEQVRADFDVSFPIDI
jgi:glucose dehydrogenase